MQQILIKQYDPNLFPGNEIKVAGYKRKIESVNNTPEGFLVSLTDYSGQYLVMNKGPNRKQRRAAKK